MGANRHSLVAESYGGIAVADSIQVPQWTSGDPLETVGQSNERWVPLSSHPAFTIEDKLEQSFESITGGDHRARTSESMQDAIGRLANLGKTNDYALYKYAMSAHEKGRKAIGEDNPVEALRANRTYIAAMAGLGSAWLETGSRTLDLGGKAILALTMAKNKAQLSWSLYERLSGQDIDGKVVDAKEHVDLDVVIDFIEKKIALTEQPHDLQLAKKTLKDFLTTSRNQLIFERQKKFQHEYLDDTSQKIVHAITDDKNGSSFMSDPSRKRLVAKLLRDQALATMVKAEIKLDSGDVFGANIDLVGTQLRRHEIVPGTSTSRGYDGIIEMLKLSESLSPTNPDLVQLKKMTEELRLRVAEQQQEHQA